MKNFYFVSIILLCGCFQFSCKKDPVQMAQPAGKTSSNTKLADTLIKWPALPIDPTLLVGNWQVINDTSTTVPFFTNYPTMGKNYIGSPSDYYKFTAGGQFYCQISGTVDTGNYVIDKNMVNIVYAYFNG